MRTSTMRHNAMTPHICRLAAGGIAALAIAAAAASGPARAEDGPFWVGTWGAGPTGTSFRTFTNQTIRQVARISVGSDQFRIRLSNESAFQAVQIGDAHVAISAGGGAIKAGTDRVLTFNGRPTVKFRLERQC